MNKPISIEITLIEDGKWTWGYWSKVLLIDVSIWKKYADHSRWSWNSYKTCFLKTIFTFYFLRIYDLDNILIPGKINWNCYRPRPTAEKLYSNLINIKLRNYIDSLKTQAHIFWANFSIVEIFVSFESGKLYIFLVFKKYIQK